MRFHIVFLEDFLTFPFRLFMIYYQKIQSFRKVEENECSEGRNEGMCLLLRKRLLSIAARWIRNLPKLWRNRKTKRNKITFRTPFSLTEFSF